MNNNTIEGTSVHLNLVHQFNLEFANQYADYTYQELMNLAKENKTNLTDYLQSEWESYKYLTL